jgi:hypothetical protein
MKRAEALKYALSKVHVRPLRHRSIAPNRDA